MGLFDFFKVDQNHRSDILMKRETLYCALTIKVAAADGKISAEELNCLKNRWQELGFTTDEMQSIHFSAGKMEAEDLTNIAKKLSYDERKDLIDFLTIVANADGKIDKDEVSFILKIITYIGLPWESYGLDYVTKLINTTDLTEEDIVNSLKNDNSNPVVELATNFEKNIEPVKNLYEIVKSQSEEMDSHILKNNININDADALENLNKFFADLSREQSLADIDNLVKILPPEECLENIYKIIDGYHLICKELRKFIEGSQKLYNQGKIPGVSRFLLLDYNAAISLQMASVTLLVIISNDPKYSHLSSKIPIEKIGFYLNRPMA